MSVSISAVAAKVPPYLREETEFVLRSFDLNLTAAAEAMPLGRRARLIERLGALMPTGLEAITPEAVREIRSVLSNRRAAGEFREAFRIAVRRAEGLVAQLEHDAPDALPDVIRLQNEAELFMRAADFALADA